MATMQNAVTWTRKKGFLIVYGRCAIYSQCMGGLEVTTNNLPMDYPITVKYCV